MINSSLTSKQAHVCIVTTIAASLMVSWDSSSFSSNCSDRIPKRQREQGIEASILYFSVRSIFSLLEHYLANPNGWDVWKWIKNHISKFHDNPTVKRSRILVILRQFWVSMGKEKATIQRVFFSASTSFCNLQRWECSRLSFEPGA